jgi:hypothetical protein
MSCSSCVSGPTIVCKPVCPDIISITFSGNFAWGSIRVKSLGRRNLKDVSVPSQDSRMELLNKIRHVLPVPITSAARNDTSTQARALLPSIASSYGTIWRRSKRRSRPFSLQRGERRQPARQGGGGVHGIASNSAGAIPHCKGYSGLQSVATGAPTLTGVATSRRLFEARRRLFASSLPQRFQQC